MSLKRWMSHPFVRNVGGLMLSTGIQRWMATLDYKTAYYDSDVDPARCDLSRRRHIYIFWHEYIPYQLYLRGNCHICMLLSVNRDAEWLARAAMHLGFDTVRGSTFAAPRRAVRELLRKSRDCHLTITPDGPRGPRRRLSPGSIYLSSKLQIPLVALGMGYDRPWRLQSWDRFAIPRLYTRARCIMSPPLQIPANLSDDQLERYRLQVERWLNRLTDEAEHWAEAGTRCERELPTCRAPRLLPRHAA